MQYSRTPVRRYTQASVANAAAATKTGNPLDMTEVHKGHLLTLITNGATGPTVPATATFQIDLGDGTWLTVREVVGSTTANAVTRDFWEVPPCVRCRVNFAGNTAQPVTVESSMIAYRR